MCGRYSLKTDYKTLARRFDAEPSEPFGSRYNISPTQEVPVILNIKPGQIELARWGIVPVWDSKRTIINARSESLDKPTFRKPFRERRCLVLADSFFEWRTEPGKKAKRPFRFLLKSEEPFAFAGIWNEQEGAGGAESRFALITTEPNGIVGRVHDRMPVILKPEAESLWLDLDTVPEQALELLQPYPDDEMKMSEVSTLVNSPANDGPEIFNLEP